MMPDSACLGKF